MISYDTMVTEVTARLGNRSDIGARIGRWINYAYYELLLSPRYSFFELDTSRDVNFIANVSTFDFLLLGNFWTAIHLVDITNSYRLERTSLKTLDEIVPTVGFTQRYAHFGTTAYFDPTNSQPWVLRVRYRQRPPDLVSGTIFAGIGNEWEEPMVLLATVKGWEALDQRDKAQEQRGLLEPMLAMRQDVPQLEDGLDNEVTIAPTAEFRGM